MCVINEYFIITLGWQIHICNILNFLWEHHVYALLMVGKTRKKTNWFVFYFSKTRKPNERTKYLIGFHVDKIKNDNM